MAEQKRTDDIAWDDLRYFLALSRAGSLSATARHLHVNHATVARRLASLETTIGCALFDRRTDGYVLTADGQSVLIGACAMEEAALGVARHRDTSGALNGLVRLTTTRSLADGFLSRRLGLLQTRHPGIHLELLADLRLLSLSRREADIAIRLGRPSDSAMIGRRLGYVDFDFYVSAHAERTAGEPALIGYDEDSDFVPEARWMAARFPRLRFSFRSNSQLAQAEAARGGFGAVLLPTYVGRIDPDLISITLGPVPPRRELWLLVRPDLARVPRMRAVLTCLTDIFRQESALFNSADRQGNAIAPPFAAEIAGLEAS